MNIYICVYKDTIHRRADGARMAGNYPCLGKTKQGIKHTETSFVFGA